MTLPDNVSPDTTETTLLTVGKFAYAGNVIIASEVREGRLILKHRTARTYLVVTPLQRHALASFGAGRTVSEVLCDLIAMRRAFALRDFYEVVLKGIQAGVLCGPGVTPPAEEAAVNWRARVGAGWARWLAQIAMAAATIMVLVKPMVLPGAWPDLVLGWLACCLASSAGYALAACVVRGAGCEVYHPQLKLATLAPHFRVDLGDVIMGGRSAEVSAALVRLAPQFVGAALAGIYAPQLGFPMLLGLLFNLSPLWKSPTWEVVRALYRGPRLGTTYDFLFAQNRLFTVLWRARLKHVNGRLILYTAIYTVLWMVLVVTSGCALWQLNAAELSRRFWESGGLHFTALTMLVVLALMVCGVGGLAVWIAGREWLRWRHDRRVRQRPPEPTEISAESARELLGRTALLHELPPDQLDRILGAVSAEEYEPGAEIVRQGEHGDQLYVVFTGLVEVVRENESGTAEVVAKLQTGDVFGEMALLGDGIRTRTVRCAKKATVLVLGRESFENLILHEMSRQAVAAAVQKIAFLERVPLARQWSPHAMACFARRSIFQDFSPSSILIEKGTDNQFFFLLYEGQVSVRKNRKDEIGRLTVGDFFGEISLLRDSIATANIITVGPCRCLVMGRKDFLRFITSDFHVGLQFEAIGSARLGQPVFRQKGRSLELLRG